MHNGQEHFSSVWFCECECEIIFPYQSITPTIYVSNIFCIFGKRNVIIKIIVFRLKNYHQITTFNLYNFILYNTRARVTVVVLNLTFNKYMSNKTNVFCKYYQTKVLLPKEWGAVVVVNPYSTLYIIYFVIMQTFK